MSQLKLSLKIRNNISIGGPGPPGPTPWLRPWAVDSILEMNTVKGL